MRKRACFDLIEVFSELHQTDPEVFKQRVGLDEDDDDDDESEEEAEESNEEDMLGSDEEAEAV